MPPLSDELAYNFGLFLFRTGLMSAKSPASLHLKHGRLPRRASTNKATALIEVTGADVALSLLP